VSSHVQYLPTLVQTLRLHVEHVDSRHTSRLSADAFHRYAEAVDILYRTSNLYFSNFLSICVFPRTVISHHLDNVRHLRLWLTLHWREDGLVANFHNTFGGVWPGWNGGAGEGDTPWECVWAVVASMRSLHTLIVTLQVPVLGWQH
jgi:hypothetical protein